MWATKTNISQNNLYIINLFHIISYIYTNKTNIIIFPGTKTASQADNFLRNIWW